MMRKMMKNILLVVCSLVLVLAFPLSVSAAATSVSATNNGGKITVTGNANGTTVACAICVYDASNQLVAMETCEVKADNTYSYTLTNALPNGTYTVKVADYNGGDFVTTSVTIEDSSVPAAAAQPAHVKDNVPKTADATPYALYFAIATLALCGVVVFGKKKDMR